MALLLSLSQDQGAYSDTPLEEIKQPTIAEYFSMQNKTLGGSSTKRLSELLKGKV